MAALGWLRFLGHIVAGFFAGVIARGLWLGALSGFFSGMIGEQIVFVSILGSFPFFSKNAVEIAICPFALPSPRCLEIFENYCTVTQRVRKGIDVNVTVL